MTSRLLLPLLLFVLLAACTGSAIEESGDIVPVDDFDTCDDGRDCTTDTCDGLGDCVFAVAAGFCLADGVCASDGEAAPHDPCLICDADAAPTVEAGSPATLDGVLAGAISKQAILDGIEAVSEDQLPLDKDLIIQMIQGMIQSDIDTDGDGVKDAASVGLPFTAIRGTIVGLAAE